MDNRQAKEFIKLMVEAYPSFELTPGRVKVWTEMLTDIEYGIAVKRLKEHIATHKFAPTIAEILNPDENMKRNISIYDELGDLIPGALDKTPI